MEQPKKEPSTTLIYVSNLPFETTDEQFRDLFKGFTVKTAYVAKRKNGKSKGFGFVNLEKESDQKAAIEKVNGLEFEKRKLIAKVAMNDDRRNEKGELKEEFKTATTNTQQPPSETVVYVSNLAWTVTDEELRKIFAEFNPKTVTVATRKNGRSKGFGFVEFNSKEDREKALSLDQKTFSERQISVKQSTGFREKRTDNNNNNSDRKGRNNNNRRSKSPRRNRDNNNRRSKSPRRNNNNNNNSNNNNNNRRNDNNRTERKRSEFALYVKNLPFELDDQDLRDVFKDFHPTAANIASRGGKSRGFGFVEFGNAKDRDDAQRNLDQSEINDRLVSVTVSSPSNNNRDNNRDNNRGNNNRDNNRENRPRRTDRSPRRQRDNSNRQASSSTVHVSNLEFSIDDKALEEVFTGLKIVKAYVARTQSGRSKGFGFVEFKTAEDQQNSLKKNGSEVKGRPIKVQASYVKEENKSN